MKSNEMRKPIHTISTAVQCVENEEAVTCAFNPSAEAEVKN